MFTLLKRYRAALLRRIREDNFVQIFERALGRGLPRTAVLVGRRSDSGGGPDVGGANGDYATKPDLWLTQVRSAIV